MTKLRNILPRPTTVLFKLSVEEAKYDVGKTSKTQEGGLHAECGSTSCSKTTRQEMAITKSTSPGWPNSTTEH
jgi:hypothetical protein